MIESGRDTDIETTKGERTTSTEPKEEFEAENQLAVVRQRAGSTTQSSKAQAERADDPLRIYLRDMGSMELLSREGEVAIAKRIEAGREAMMAGLCESSLTFQAIAIWRDELYGGKVLLRDIIDLDATNADRGVKPTSAAGSDIERHAISDYLPGQPERSPQMPASPPQCGTAGEPIGDRTPTSHEVSESDVDEDDMQKWLSISAMEAELTPRVFETFNSIADNFKRLRRLQELNIQGKLKNERLSPAQERKSKEFKRDILAEVKSLRLNEARIDALVEHLYEINKQLLGYEGQLMRLAELHGISRECFLRPLELLRQLIAGSRIRPSVGARSNRIAPNRRSSQGRESSRHCFGVVSCPAGDHHGFTRSPTFGEQGFMRIFIFKSEAKPDLRAFGGDLAGSQLPVQFKPWRAVGAVSPTSSLHTSFLAT